MALKEEIKSLILLGAEGEYWDFKEKWHDNKASLLHDIICMANNQVGMTGKLALPSLIALCSIALGKPVLSSTAILGEISISGTIIKVDELANALQVCLDSGAKRVLLPMTAAAELGTVPADLIGCFNLIFYSSAEDAVFKALGVE